MKFMEAILSYFNISNTKAERKAESAKISEQRMQATLRLGQALDRANSQCDSVKEIAHALRPK